ncbi:MAG: YceI family protein [Phycisphaerales bacterium]|nr:YceI family protein [Phycisphaerales bacterium]
MMLRRTLWIALIGACLLPSLALATARSAQLETWKLDPVHCMALFRVQHAGAGQFWGRFNDVTGTVTYPRDDSSAPEFNVTVATKSIDTGTAKLDRNLQGPDFFNAREFETMTFKSTGAERIGPRKWKVKGDLTLLGKTEEVEAVIETTGVIGNPVVAKAGWEATFSVFRSDFGMNWGVDNGALGDEVRLIVGLEGDTGPGA